MALTGWLSNIYKTAAFERLVFFCSAWSPGCPPHRHPSCCCLAEIPRGSLLVPFLFPFCVSSDTWSSPPPAVLSALFMHSLQPLINRSWYWWEMNAGKWLPVKPLHAPASLRAYKPIQGWFACQPLTRLVNQSLCSSAGWVPQFMVYLWRFAFSLFPCLCLIFVRIFPLALLFYLGSPSLPPVKAFLRQQLGTKITN